MPRDRIAGADVFLFDRGLFMGCRWTAGLVRTCSFLRGGSALDALGTSQGTADVWMLEVDGYALSWSRGRPWGLAKVVDVEIF